MRRTLGSTLALTCAGFILSTALAFAGTTLGTVTRLDEQDRATVHTDDDKDHKVTGEGWKAGAQVECESKEGQTAWKASK
jgi:hypothetical protein